ncbi:hypothetical protein SAMN00777080_1357 [Aquiflexum balticum DSM 16537]|uniref:Uncharacterized protein n=1 Tax=Aquiflexum balticum DSM 16537 TaxID=758820 RepID=A0A1W2H2D8_9BACT|nr:hypothetical protein SAMN00777080_1357 [Aquiflexum balticum DSM 16537]
MKRPYPYEYPQFCILSLERPYGIQILVNGRQSTVNRAANRPLAIICLATGS